ncbi:MAG: SH3 domain-containing protein, partial [Synergistaceae bacterium]|nr:SH3 domain-containing protein [Synergistaceae bacterium]
LFIAVGLCVPARDTWLYGGLYFFAALLCFFLKSRDSLDYYYDYDDQQEDADFYYDPDIPAPSPEELGQETFNIPSPIFPEDPLNNAELSENEALQLNPEPLKLRRHRMSKSCHECGAVVSREARFCPTCGARLHVMPDDSFIISGRDDDIDVEKLNNQLLAPANDSGVVNEEITADENTALLSDNLNGSSVVYDNADENKNAPDLTAVENPRRVSDDSEMRNTRRSSGLEAASSYREFSKVANKGKVRNRSAGRKVLSMILLISAVGGALYFLLGLRKLPPGDLPPIARTEVVKEDPVIQVDNVQEVEAQNPQKTQNEELAENIGIAVAENVLPNFVPDREPKIGIISGNAVNVRSDHTTSSQRVTRLKSGTRVDILGTFNVTSGQHQGIWYNIRTGSNEGWVYGQYLRPTGSGLPAGYSSALLKTFGNSKSQIVDALGRPTSSTSSSAEWPGLTVTFKGEDITRVRLTGSARELQNGLKVGMSQTALYQIMGYPSSINNRTMNYNEGGKTGLSIQLDRNNSISS